MSPKETLEHPEYGFSKAIEKSLERYFTSHKGNIIPEGLYNRIIDEVERVVFGITLKYSKGNQLQASKTLGINRNTLRKKIAKLNVGENNN